MSQDIEDEVSDVVARANKMQREKKRKHGIRTTTSSGSKKSTTATNVSRVGVRGYVNQVVGKGSSPL